jgi:hypothetical protein
VGRVFGGEDRVIDGHIKDYQLPTGTQEELISAWRLADEYMYNILSYAPKMATQLTAEELANHRRYMQFLRLGPRAGHLIHDTKSKLTSADVLYILTCCLPAKYLEKVYNVSYETINGIRRNAFVEWSWEYYFVKRIKTHVKSEIYKLGGSGRNNETACARFYKLEKLNTATSKFEVMAYISGLRKAQTMRVELLPKREYRRLLRSRTLDIVYPITRIDLM